MLLLLEARDPRLAEVTITAAEVTPDLLQARVFYTVLGDAEQKAAAQAGLDRAAGFLRTQLAARIQLRKMPELIFEYDKSIAYGQRIDELLDQLAHEPPPPDAQSD